MNRTVASRVRGVEVDGVRLEVDPGVGGRITSLRLGGDELLSGPDADPNNYGSTFWTSPQSDWGWPPPAPLDRAPYAVDDGGGHLALSGRPSEPLGVRVDKRITVDAPRGCFVVEYAVHNVGPTPRSLAPWEVTRVRPGGLTFFPSGGTPSSGTLSLEERPGCTWYRHEAARLPIAGQKAFADGPAGLLAHAAGNLLYVKRFEAVRPDEYAPGERSVEIYACPRYVELEVQGPYRAIAPGECVRWSVAWAVRRLPPGLAATLGSGDLLDFARQVAVAR